MLKILFLFTLLIFSNLAYGVMETTTAEDIAEKARTRNFPGGNDEEKLKVQDSIDSPTLSVFKSNLDQEVLKEFREKKAKEEESKAPIETE